MSHSVFIQKGDRIYTFAVENENMRIYPFKAIYPDLDLISSPDSFFDTVRQNFPEYVHSGFYNRFEQPGIFIYQIKHKKTTHTGIVATLDIRDYLEGRVLKHENTLASKEQESTELVLNREAMIKPVLFAYPHVEEIRAYTEGLIGSTKKAYRVDFEEEDLSHIIWKVEEEERIQEIRELFSRHIPKVFVADGHHRTEVTAKLYRSRKNRRKLEFDRILTGFFPFDQLEIHDYNRIVEVLNFITPTLLMARLARIAHIEPMFKAGKPQRKGELTMMLNEEWYRLQWKKSILKEYRSEVAVTDYQIFNEKILIDIFHISDVRSDDRIKYVDGVSGIQMIKEKTQKSEQRMAFCLFPVSMEEFMEISDHHEVLPPKSTWFEPRLINGIIIQSFRKE